MLLMKASGHGDFIGGHVVTFHLLEEQPAATVVGNLAESVREMYRLGSEMSRKLQFQLIFDDHEKEKDAYRFDVDAESGVLTAGQSVDREHVCRSSPKRRSQRGDGDCFIVLRVRVSTNDLIGDFQVRVVVDDINDHDPRFASATVELSFPETATTGTLKQLPAATDLDVGQNGRLSYRLVPASDVFDLVLLSGDDAAGSGDVFLRLHTSIDREKRSFFSLTLVAVDSGNPRRTGSLSVAVTVSDANDHAPTFNTTRYEFTTSENRPIGSVIGRVQAMDADAGGNARVTYIVTRINGNDAPLTVDAETGQVVVVGQLDFERRADYVLTVAAADSAPPPLRQSGYVLVIVHVIDENDNAPEVIISGSGSSAAEVAENSEMAMTVLELSVFDADSELAGQVEVCRVTYSEDHSADLPPFSLVRRPSYSDPARYSLVTDSALDREGRDRYSLLVSCVDAGVPPLTGQTVVDVRVLDSNDNAPMFRGVTPISVSLPEGNSIDEYISTIGADDADLGENGSVSYSIRCFEDGDNASVAVLRIDNATGVVRAAVSLDREGQADYDCLVIAADAGRPSLSSSAHLLLRVLDVDDQLAAYQQRFYEFHVAENLPAGSVVGRVTALDADDQPFNHVVYFLDSGANSSSLVRM